MKNSSKQNYTDLISKISLFSSIDKQVVDQILKNAEIKIYKKGELIFSQNQKVGNLYILLKGTAKTWVINDDGEEVILQIFDNISCINNIFDSVFSANASATSELVILTIPITQIRKDINNNPRLSINLMVDLGKQNQQLFNQLNLLKLNDAKQKVGQFLLGIAFEKGIKNKKINLQINKSEIASYLMIRPETLSRILQKLKNDGEITIENNQIILLNQNSLCQYCNTEIANKCIKSESTPHEIDNNLCICKQ